MKCRNAVGNTQLKVKDRLTPLPVGSTRIEGWLGHKLGLCIDNRVVSQDTESLVYPFRIHQDESEGFRCEFWGKWFTSAALGYTCRPSNEIMAAMDSAVAGLLETQALDGYIGTYHPEHHLGTWDIWGRKYVLLGLIAYYDLTARTDVLQAICRSLDHLIGEAGPGKTNLTETGFPAWKGLPPSSVLEPVVLAYQRTGESKYLDFAEHIVAQWSEPNKLASDGLRLVENALAGVPAEQVGIKAYEMMSCYEGLCELYRVTGKRAYLDAVLAVAESIMKTEIFVTGSGSNHELWMNGARYQTGVLEQPGETCVTVTWMKLCSQLLRITGNPAWADEMEVSLYNGLLGSMTPDGGWWSYYSPLIGERVPSHMQFSDVGLSCCVANGPRGLLLTPNWALMSSEGGLTVNLYAPGSAHANLANGTSVSIIQETDYPAGNEVILTVNPDVECDFSLRLRIPRWSKRTFLSINGEEVPCEPGTYAAVERTWKAGDRIILRLDMRGRAIPAPSGAPESAIMRGPIVLALDNRLVEAQDVAVRLVTDAEGYVELNSSEGKPDDVWMAFDVPFEVRPSHVFGHYRTSLRMCDFCSAGNRWSSDNLYRVWLPEPLFLRNMFVTDTWKLMYPDCAKRPVIECSENEDI